MTPHHRERIAEAIMGKLGTRRLVCPISGDNSPWEVNRFLSAHPAVGHPRDPFPGKGSFPVAVLMCMDCGYEMFVNLIQLGLAEELEIPEMDYE